MTSMSARIRRARCLAAMTQAELSRRIGVQRSAVAQWENAGGTTPSVAHLAQVAFETRVCFEWLATGRGPARPDGGAFDDAAMLQDFALDEVESRVLVGLRRVSRRKRDAILKIVELLSG